MDEPLGALDKKLREWLQMELRRIHRELGSTFIYVTHDQEEALVLSDRIVVFNEGSIEQVGTAHELYEAPRTLFVAKFIGESSVFSGELSEGVVRAGELEFAGRGEVRPGPAAVVVRPEKLLVSGVDGAGLPADVTNRVVGEIEDIVYLGSAVKYSVTTVLGEAVVRVPVESSHAAKIGDRVMVGWRTADGVLLADEG
ncbi:ABC transporter ATP-binding protein [Leucobacter soli]